VWIYVSPTDRSSCITHPRYWLKHCDQRVSVSVSLSVRSHVSKPEVRISLNFLYTGPETTLYFVEFARWRHRGRSCCLLLQACD